VTGSQLGVAISYVVQDQPNGLAEALLLGEVFLDGDGCALILATTSSTDRASVRTYKRTPPVEGALIFAYQAGADPRRTTASLSTTRLRKVIAAEEKPLKAKSTYGRPGDLFLRCQGSGTRT